MLGDLVQIPCKSEHKKQLPLQLLFSGSFVNESSPFGAFARVQIGSDSSWPSTLASWWLNQPIWKIWVKIGSFPPRIRDEHKKKMSCHHPVGVLTWISDMFIHSIMKNWILPQTLVQPGANPKFSQTGPFGSDDYFGLNGRPQSQ